MATNAVVPAVEAEELDQNANWTDPQGRSPHDQRNVEWAAARSEEIEAGKAIKNTLGLEHELYRSQLDALPSEERAALAAMSAEDLTAHLDGLREAERDAEKVQKDLDAQLAERSEAAFAPRETPEIKEVRHAMKAAYDGAAALDERIAELQMLNSMREDISDPHWDDPDIDADTWRLAREKGIESFDGEINALLAQKQALLTEAGLHQSAYHNAVGSPPVQPSAPAVDPVVAQILTPNGPAQVTAADIASLVQAERDTQAHRERMAELNKHRDIAQVQRQAAAVNAAGIDITPGQAAFVTTLPNSAEVAHYLLFNPEETRALARMSAPDATRALIAISHKATRQNASTTGRRTTAAPKPPSPVNGSSRGDFDVNDESGSADDWFKRRNEQLRRNGR